MRHGLPADGFDRDPTTGVALVMASVVVAFGWSHLLGLRWWPVVGAVALVAFALVVFGLVRGARTQVGAITTGLALMGAVALLRAWPLSGASAPPGGDTSMHLWLARVATVHPVLPAVQTPLYPGLPYDAYPLGFHAWIAWLARDPSHLVGAALATIVLTHVLFAGAVHSVARSFTTPVVAALAALLTVTVLRNPQAYVGWGGHPCVMGFAFALLAWQALGVALDRPSTGRVLAMGLFSAATVMTHPTAALVLAAALSGTALERLVRARRARTLVTVSACAALAGLLALPLLLAWSRAEFSVAERAWIASHHLRAPQSPLPSLDLLPRYWTYVFGDAAIGWAAVGVICAIIRRRRRPLALALVAMVGLPFAAVAFRHSGLPLALTAYPERVVLVLVVAWSWFFAQVLETVGVMWRAEHRAWAGRAGAGFVVVALGITAAVGVEHYAFDPARDGRRVDALDLRAFDAIAALDLTERTLGREPLVVEHRLGDAAAFLPALRGVAVTDPQWNPVWLDELERWRAGHPATVVYARGAAKAPAAEIDASGSRRLLVARFASETDTVWVWRRSPPPDGFTPDE